MARHAMSGTMPELRRLLLEPLPPGFGAYAYCNSAPKLDSSVPCEPILFCPGQTYIINSILLVNIN